MLNKDRVILPTDIINSNPPSFFFTLLAVNRTRKREADRSSFPESAAAVQVLSKQIEDIENGIINFIDMDDQERWTFLRSCLHYIQQDYCEYCYKKLPPQTVSIDSVYPIISNNSSLSRVFFVVTA